MPILNSDLAACLGFTQSVMAWSMSSLPQGIYKSHEAKPMKFIELLQLHNYES